MNFFADMFGYLLNLLYELFKNYGIAIIVFSVILKIVLLPISLKQQKTMKKTTKIQGELQNIREKYKNEPMKMNQETMDVYKRENMSPFSGCLSAIVQMVLLISMFLLVRSPLTHMKKIDVELVHDYTNQIKMETEAKNLRYPEIAIIRDVHLMMKKIENGEEVIQDETGEDVDIPTEGEGNSESLPEEPIDEAEESLEVEDKEIKNVKTVENIEKLYINMELLGLDLSSVPNEQAKDFRVYIIPVLYVMSTFISMKLTMKLTQNKQKDTNDKETGEKKEEKPNDMQALNSMNKNMSYLMPVLSISISMVAPLGLALYWLVNNILMIIERLLLNKFLKSEEGENAK